MAPERTAGGGVVPPILVLVRPGASLSRGRRRADDRHHSRLMTNASPNAIRIRAPVFCGPSERLARNAMPRPINTSPPADRAPAPLARRRALPVAPTPAPRHPMTSPQPNHDQDHRPPLVEIAWHISEVAEQQDDAKQEQHRSSEQIAPVPHGKPPSLPCPWFSARGRARHTPVRRTRELWRPTGAAPGDLTVNTRCAGRVIRSAPSVVTAN